MFTQPGDVNMDQTSRNKSDGFADKPRKGESLGEIQFECKYLVACEIESGRTCVDGETFAKAGTLCASFEPWCGVDGEQSSHLLAPHPGSSQNIDF